MTDTRVRGKVGVDVSSFSSVTIARLVGDQFVVFPAVASPRQAREKGGRILGLLKPGFELEEETLTLSGGVGIALALVHAPEPERGWFIAVLLILLAPFVLSGVPPRLLLNLPYYLLSSLYFVLVLSVRSPRKERMTSLPPYPRRTAK